MNNDWKKRPVMITISGSQCTPGEKPEVVELTVSGTLEIVNGGYQVTYEESELTGLEGTTTTFHVTEDSLILRRCGSVNSEMVFIEGTPTESLYDMGFGAMLVQVCARKLEIHLDAEGGSFDLRYAIDVEQTPLGVIDYHVTVTPTDRPKLNLPVQQPVIQTECRP